MKLTSISKLFIACTLAVAFAGCLNEEVSKPQEEFLTSTEEQAVSCTPGAKTCDFGCNFDGAQWNGPTPTSDDCIIRCNSAGNGWELVVNCGWAQNFPYSSSCLDSQPTRSARTTEGARCACGGRLHCESPGRGALRVLVAHVVSGCAANRRAGER